MVLLKVEATVGKRAIVLVLDGFGMGAMEDTKIVRPQDGRADTCGSLFAATRGHRLETLERLGLVNAYGKPIPLHEVSPEAIFGKMKLTHFGADTFFGHQEIMGTKPKEPVRQIFEESYESVASHLKKHGYSVKTIRMTHGPVLLVNNRILVGDNLETDPGQAFNITTSFDFTAFEELVRVGELVRAVVTVPRVIAFGGKQVNLQAILSAMEERDTGAVGINAPRAGVYQHDYRVLHMGYGVDASVQAPWIVGEAGMAVCLIGKVADIVENPFGTSLPAVKTEEVMDKVHQALAQMTEGFICANVQETDLAGHAENPELYMKKLELVDASLKELLKKLTDEDLLMVIADHGNDPCIGHAFHTREHVPLLVYKRGASGCALGIRQTLSDVGQTVCDFLGTKRKPENGTSFLGELL